jgi:hypothetical protein
MKNKLQKRTRVWNPPSNFSHKGTQRGTKKEGEKSDDGRQMMAETTSNEKFLRMLHGVQMLHGGSFFKKRPPWPPEAKVTVDLEFINPLENFFFFNYNTTRRIK